MKRVKGFTLAEILITLGIIGVVAALTAPALIQNAGNAKIGPTLQKVKSSIENANEMMLLDNTAANLYAVANNTSGYMELLSEYISGSSYNSTEVSTTDTNYFNPAYTKYNGSTAAKFSVSRFSFSDSITLLFEYMDAGWNAAGSFDKPYMRMLVDINGITNKPNSFGKDVFFFFMDRNGHVVPYGSAALQWLLDKSGCPTNIHWDQSSASSDYICNDSNVNSGYSCAGSIFDNGLKVIYQ